MLSKPRPACEADDRPRILYVEDEVVVRMDVADTLRAEGWVVVEAGTVHDALQAVRSDRFDLVLTDVHLSGDRTGIDLARLVRRDHPGLNLVVMSALHRPASGETDLFDAFLTKPAGDLVGVLRGILATRRT